MKLVLPAGLILGAVLWWISHQVGAFEATPAAPAAASGTAVERHAVDPRLAPARQAISGPPPAVDPSAEPASLHASESNPEAVAAARRARMQAYFADQPVDRSWASTAQYALQDDLRKVVGDGVRLQRVECRSSLCRAELTAPTRDAANAFLESWLQERTWTGPGFASHDDTDPGSPRMILFLGRPGTALPASE
jgi:hypothetical protein